MGFARSTRSVLIGLAVVACALGLVTANAVAEPAGSGGQVVEYAGYQLTVPADWAVVDLTREPTECVRFDRQAVYLGRPGERQDCPTDLVGRADALLIQPADQAAADQIGGGEVVRVGSGQPLPVELPATADHEFAVALDDAGVVVRASYRDTPAAIRRVLATGELTGAQTASELPAPTPSGYAAAVVAPGTYAGAGFDACTAPSSQSMDAWLGSPYHAIGIYVGGVSRACSQSNLTADWVAHQTGNGWHLIPIYVGRQAPCSGYATRIDPGSAFQQGVEAGSDAAAQAAALGLAAGSVLFNDMESYDSNDVACREGVLQFLSGWTAQLHGLGYRSGVYSSASTGIRDLVSIVGSPGYAVPDAVWFARWNGVATTDDPVLPADYWNQHQRIKQYQGGHDESYNGVTINIDSNQLDIA